MDATEIVYVIGGGTVVVVLGYLFVALLKPEIVS